MPPKNEYARRKLRDSPSPSPSSDESFEESKPTLHKLVKVRATEQAEVNGTNPTPKPTGIPTINTTVNTTEITTVDVRVAENEQSASASTPNAIVLPTLAYVSDPHIHVQAGGCNTLAYRNFSKCRSCILKIGKGDTCRFKGFRAFRKNLGVLEYGPWFISAKSDVLSEQLTEPLVQIQQPTRLLAAAAAASSSEIPSDSTLLGQNFSIKIPSRHTVSSNPIHELYILKTTAPVLLSILAEELKIFSSKISCGLPVMFRPAIANLSPPKKSSSASLESSSRNTVLRQHCDQCLTSIFNTHYMCAICGKEICAKCFKKLPLKVTDVTTMISNRVVLFPEQCGRGTVHVQKQFILLAKISKEDVEAVVKVAEFVVDLEKNRSPDEQIEEEVEADEEGEEGDEDGEKKAEEKDSEADEKVEKDNSTAKLTGEESTSINSNLGQNDLIQANVKRQRKYGHFDVVGDSKNYLRLYGDDEQAYEKFQQQWKQGKAVIFEGCAGNIQADWNPAYFIQHHGKEITTVVDCVTKENISMDVGEFFSYFTDSNLIRKKILKLPDWPSHSEFERKFPNHFADFKRSVPFADYSSFTGARNLAARLPQEFLPPDLGPKMYNAFGSSDGEHVGQKGFGTTPIHLDMADAVNVMMYASTLENRTDLSEKANTAAAVWDIYPRAALPKLRNYLTTYAARHGNKVDDPVHDQFFYLNEAMRQELWDSYGVQGWRIFQNPGDAVFVPAGCAHQVCNYKDCIKAACDFVSPENLRACVRLTGEFRKLSKTHRRREDLLNLKSTLWSVWMSCPLLKESEQDLPPVLGEPEVSSNQSTESDSVHMQAE
ncbi:hypothetical protein HK100_004868 [Physocladia obscura]|uniref:JmjC domain-containing protein n=1 Tax=Physocladia obscura TaxID=109957 RepID=A0AAD5X8H4_9FUNG|nr:hypothetical protein HK100_004868 [Physocladia obscura]